MTCRASGPVLASLAAIVLLGGAAPAAAQAGRYPELAPPGECAEPPKGLSAAPPWFPGLVPAALPSVDAAGPPATQIVSLVGDVTVEPPGGVPRVVECGDSLSGGVRVATGVDSSAGILVGGVLVQLDSRSAVKVSLTPDGVADVRLEDGGVRVIDSRSSGAPVRLAAGDLETGLSGQDAELRMQNGAAALRDGPATIMALGAPCEAEPPIRPLAHLEPLPIVSAPRVGPELPDAPSGPRRSPCDVPGSGCTGRDATGGPVVEEQPPTTDPFPGGGGF